MHLRTRATIVSIIATAVISAVPGHAAAQASRPESAEQELTDLSLDELAKVQIISAASSYEQHLAEAPASVTVITAQDIRTYGYRTLADALRSAAGLYVTDDRNYEYLGVRGFGRFGSYNSRILLLVDGHRLNENIYDAAGIGSDFAIDVDLIDRIEIVRGPSSSLYGTNALFGVINVVTRPAVDVDGLRVATTAASFGSRAVRATVARTFTAAEIVVSGTLFQSDGSDLYFPEFDRSSTNNGRAVGVDGQTSRNAFLKASFGTFTLEAVHSLRTKHIPTASFDTLFDDPRTKTTDEREFVEGRYERAAGHTQLLGRVFYDQALYHGTYAYASDAPDQAVSLLDDIGDGRWLGAELKATRMVGGRHRVTAGTVWRYNLHQNQSTSIDGVTSLDDQRSSGFWAVYAQDEFQLTRQLRLNLGLRHDQYGTFGGTTNPRAAVIYMPDEATSVKLLYGRAFRAPNAYELYYQDGGLSQKPALTLSPETMRTYEAVVERRLSRNVQISASVYDYALDDLVTALVDPADNLLVFRNHRAVDAAGLELTTQAHWKGGWGISASHAYEGGANPESRDFLARAAHHVTHGNLAVPISWSHLIAGIELHRSSSRQTLDGAHLPPFTLLNLTVQKTWFGRLTASTNFDNIFGAVYSDPAGEEHRQAAIPQDGRSWHLQLRYHF